MTYINLNQAINNFSNDCKSNPAKAKKEHHLEFDKVKGWSVVQGAFTGTDYDKNNLADIILKAGESVDEGLCKRVNGVLNNSFPELKSMLEKKKNPSPTNINETISPVGSIKGSPTIQVSRQALEDLRMTKELVRIELQFNPAGVVEEIRSNALSKNDFISMLQNETIIDIYEGENLARNPDYLIKNIKDKELRAEFVLCLAKTNPQIVAYYNYNNGYKLNPEGYEKLNQQLK